MKKEDGKQQFQKNIFENQYQVYIFAPQYRGVEQLVARRAHNPKVAGSSPVPATK